VAIDHLAKDHSIQLIGAPDTRIELRQLRIDDLQDKSTGNKRQRRYAAISQAISKHPLDPQILQELYVNWITSCGVSLRMVERDEFRVLLQYLNPETNVWLPSSHNTVSSWVIEQYEAKKKQIRQNLQSAKSKIHFTVDLWTSPNYLAILGVIGHYISETGELQQAVLGLLELDGLYSGVNMASSVLGVIKDYGIASKVGYFMMDNAESNDTMIQAISEELTEQYMLNWDPIQHRLRCNGHIINLTAYAFLFYTLEEALDDTQNSESVYEIPTEVEMLRWRQKGPLGKLHNIVVHIQRSVQRRTEFQELSSGLNLIRDNSTRWNSWYTMLKSAMRPKAQLALKKYCKQHKSDIGGDRLLTTDWEDLTHVQLFLRYFFDATKATEGRTVIIERILPAMDFLLEKFEDGKALYKENPFIGPCINSGWEKLDKYYNLTNRSPVYITAMVLCPVIKWGYF
jgi:hypothetical protein